MANPTTNFSWALPTVGGSSGSWGTTLNTAFQDIDDDLNTVKTTADAALAASGGTYTGKVTHTVTEYVDTVLSGTGNLDLDAAQCFTVTISGAATLTMTGSPTSGNYQFFVIELINAGSNVTFAGGTFKWPGGSQPTFTASGTDIVVGYTRDGGTTFHMLRAGEDVS